MNLKVSLLFSFFPLLFCANAFNVTNLLSHHREFRSFNRYLTQTKLAREINSRSGLTVLALDNAAISPIAMRPMDVVKKILSVHVVLEYYDVEKLSQLSNKTTLLTTLFQRSGEASGRQGYLKVSNLGMGQVVVKSAAKGATFTAKLVKSVAAHPHNISILQIGNVIIPNGIASDSISHYALAPLPVHIASVSKAIKTTSKAKSHDDSDSSESSSSPAPAPAPSPTSSDDEAPPPSKTKRPARSPTPSSDDEAPPPSKTKRGAPPPSKTKRRSPPASEDETPAPSDQQTPAPSSDDDSGNSDAPAPGPSKSKSKSKPPTDSSSDLLPSSPDGPIDDVPIATDSLTDPPPPSAAAPFSPSLGVVLTTLLATLSLASMA